MRIGIAGVGRIGAAHAEVLIRNPEVDELVVYDADLNRAQEVAHKLGGVPVSSVAELFSADLSGVVIASASSTHPELVEAASNAGLAIFCEKPVAVDVPSTRSLLQHVTRTGVPVQVGFQRRFDPGYIACRQALVDGKIGELRRVHLLSADPAPSDARFMRTSGGIFRDLLIHDFDILRWVTGREVVEVYVQGANRGDPLFGELGDVDETGLVLSLDDGTVVTAQASRYNGAGYDIRMEVAGTESTYVVGLAERTPVHSAEPEVSFPDGAPWVWFYNRFERGYTEELNAFVDVAARRCVSPCSVEDALQALYIAEAAALSFAEKRPVLVQEIAGAGRES